MDIKKIKNAAYEYTDENWVGDFRWASSFEGFVDGAIWAQDEFVNDLWHDGASTPATPETTPTTGPRSVPLTRQRNFKNKLN